jgi:hypothetical protein
LIPPTTLDGEMHHFVNAGLYDALFVMQDVETKTLWSHITGEALHGALVGTRMPVSNLLQMTAAQALELEPTIEVAISDRPMSGRSGGIGPDNPNAALMPMFSETLGAEDTRRERMELGLGLWSDTARKYYPVGTLRERGKAVVDEFDGRTLLVYLDPLTSTPVALFVDAQDATVDGREIRLDRGRSVRDGVLLDADGQPLVVERPQQIFTRWYGFALTFPGPEIFE